MRVREKVGWYRNFVRVSGWVKSWGQSFVHTQGTVTTSPTLPSTAFAAYDPGTRSNLALGAMSLNGTSQYGVSSSPPMSEFGNGTAYVIGCRMKNSGAGTTRTGMSFGTSSSASGWCRIFIENASDDVKVARNDGSTDETSLHNTAPDGWVSVSVRLNADGTLDACILRADEDEVTWVSDATVKTVTGLDRMAVGALVRNTVNAYFDDSVVDAYFGSGATALTDAAMEAFCLGADPQSDEVGAANHWPLSETAEFTDTAGSVNLTNTGSGTFADDGADVVVSRDVTGDSGHANYAPNIAGGATMDGTNYMTGSFSEPGSDFYAVSVFDFQGTGSNEMVWSMGQGSSTPKRYCWVLSSGFIRMQEHDGTTFAIATGPSLTAGRYVVVCKVASDMSSRSIWATKVGEALGTKATNSTDLDEGAAVTVSTLRFGANQGGGDLASNGTVFNRTRMFLVSDVSDEDAFVRAVSRNWNDGSVPAPIHNWALNGNGTDTGSVGGTTMSHSAGAAWDTGLALSSHHHLLAGDAPPTYSEADGALEGNGDSNQGLKIANGLPIYSDDVACAFRAKADEVSSVDYLLEVDDGAGANAVSLRRSLDDSVFTYDTRTPNTAAVQSTVWIAAQWQTAYGWADDATGVGVGTDDVETEASHLSPAPVSTRARFMTRAAVSGGWDGLTKRGALCSVATDRTGLVDWVEAA